MKTSMKTTYPNWLTAACMVALAACSSTGNYSSDTTPSSMNTDNGGGNPSSQTSSTSNPGGAGNNASNNPTVTPSASGSSGMGSGMSSSGSSTSTAQTAYGTVQAIDQMQRRDIAAGTLGAAAAGGSVGSPTDKVYRVTVRLDDGSTQMVVVDSLPSYKAGDRIRYNNGVVERY